MRLTRFQFLWVAFLMLAMGFVFWRGALGWQVHRQLAAIRTAGEPTTWPELDKWYGAVPDRENAALVLTQAFALRRPFPSLGTNQVEEIYLSLRGEPLAPEQKQLLAEYLALNRAALAKMRDALKL